MNNRRATIDIGSNSVLLLLAEVHPFKEILKLSEITGLGRGLDKTGRFAEDSIKATMSALTLYRDTCVENGVQPQAIIATATEAARVAGNAKEFFHEVQKSLGINVQIITGTAEAELTTKGILFNTHFDEKCVTVMDIGGASTELIRVETDKGTIQRSVSLPVGSVRVGDWLADETFSARMGHLFSTYEDALDRSRGNTLYCVAGTMTSLGNMYLGRKTFEEDEVHGLKMQTTDIARLFQRCGQWTPDQFLSEFPFLGKRAQAIRGGLTLAHHLLHRLGNPQIVVSTYGLRYGTFLEGGLRHDYLV